MSLRYLFLYISSIRFVQCPYYFPEGNSKYFCWTCSWLCWNIHGWFHSLWMWLPWSSLQYVQGLEEIYWNESLIEPRQMWFVDEWRDYPWPFHIWGSDIGWSKQYCIVKRVHTPQKQSIVRSFLGLVGYYRSFIQNFSKVASPLFGLLAKDSEFCWASNCQEALEVLKENLTNEPSLRGPNWALPFHIHVDASNKVVGEALGQVEDKLPYVF